MQIQIESSATTTASSLLAYCDHNAKVHDLYTGLNWIWVTDAWVVDTGIGPQGPQGNAGANGAQGAQGAQGANGSNGAQGSQGAQGTAGSNGAQGVQGAQGSVGAQGATGPQGTAGSNGAQGAQGPQGNNGTNGSQGSQGAQGIQGADGGNYKSTSTSNVTMGLGTKSFTIAAGLSYSLDQRVVVANSSTKYMYGRVTSYSGTTLTISVDYTTDVSASYSSWTINIMGERGSVYNADSSSSLAVSTGSKSFNITITTASFVAGQRVMAAATNSGAGNYMYGVVSSYSGSTLVVAVDSVVGSGTWGGWNIALVGATGATGAQGPQGAQGAQGNQGSQGTVGSQGNQGNQGAAGSNGAQGAQGNQGTSIMNITISTSAPSGSGNEGDIWVVVPA